MTTDARPPRPGQKQAAMSAQRNHRPANGDTSNEVGTEAITCAKKLLELPQQAVEATKRLMNIQLEKSVMASLDYANLAEYVSFGTPEFNKIVDGLMAKK